MAKIRRLGAGDLAGFRAMNALFADVFELHGEYTASPPDDDYVEQWLAAPSNFAVIAEAGDAVVGALAGYILGKFEQDRRELFIYDLAVHKNCRRQGVATAMIEEVRRIARAVGAWTVFVQADTGPEDLPARALYRKLAKEEITAQHFDIAP